METHFKLFFHMNGFWM